MAAEFNQGPNIPGRIPTLEIIHDRFVRMFRITVSSALRKPVDIAVRSTELLEFGEFLDRMPVPTSLNLFRLNPLQGVAIMALETRLIFNLVDIFYGGTGELEVKAEGRDFTAIEQRLVKRVMISALEDLQTAWKPFFPVRISYQRTEINPKFVAIVPQSETVVVVNLDVDMGKEPMAITLCIPYAMIKPAVFFFIAKEKLASPLARNIAGIVNIGYRATPLPSLVQKVTDGFKRGFAPPSPAPAAPPETGGAPGHGSLDSLKWLEPATVARHIKSEHPQTIALILAHLEEPEQTARVLKELPENLQADVAYRMAILESIPPGVITEIEEVLSRELKASGETPAGKVGGVESVAQVLNTMDKLTESRILATIEQSNPVLAMQIRELMFTFEDLVLLDPAGMQAVLKEIPQNELVLSLKTASDAVKEHIFTNMSERAAGMVRDALDALGTVRMADVDLAQQKLVKIARKLEEDGKIVISGAGSGDVAVDTKEKTTPDKKKPVKKKTVVKKTTGKTKSE